MPYLIIRRAWSRWVSAHADTPLLVIYSRIYVLPSGPHDSYVVYSQFFVSVSSVNTHQDRLNLTHKSPFQIPLSDQDIVSVLLPVLGVLQVAVLALLLPQLPLEATHREAMDGYLALTDFSYICTSQRLLYYWLVIQSFYQNSYLEGIYNLTNANRAWSY